MVVATPIMRRTSRALLASVIALTACGPNATDPIGGSWLTWERASGDPAGLFVRYVPTQLPPGLRADSRAMGTNLLPTTFRAVVARVDGIRMKEPLTVYVSRGLPSVGKRRSFDTKDVMVGGAKGRLRATDLGTSIWWRSDGFHAIVAGDAGLEDEIVAVARGLSISESKGIRFESLPAKFRFVAASISPPRLVKHGTARYVSRSGAWQEASINIQYADGYSPLLSGVPVHVDAASGRRVRVRGADGIFRSSLEPRFPSGGRKVERASLTWLENPDLLITISMTGKDVTADLLRRIARSIRKISAKGWNHRFKER